MTILLIRHGETALNVGRVLQPADTPLSARGRAQAAALAQRLASMQVRAILSSDLPRAQQTAQAISAACGLEIVFEPLLQERNFGDWRGRPYDSLEQDPLSLDAAPPHGESAAVFEARVAAAFGIVRAHRARLTGPLVVVTHGLVIGAMLGSHVQLPPGRERPGRMANTSLTQCAESPPHLASLVDCTAHLDAALSADPLSLSGG